ncbi:glycosyltransferase family 2 protein [Lachnoclostridium sp. Marseille-P6806]|uniref:glycosyltransferase family 2 protein n=1 Tax=Lachnoclostridium sp. Marseille-P6806 TaxID=2364793 RepID=UPI0010327053|nr:glycosyltransferase [Lachnoclostridium sp. Marseille-P6806]
MKSIDAIIPVYHPDERLERLLARLESQDTPVRRVHLMDTRLPDGRSTLPERILSRAAQEDSSPAVRIHPVRREEFDHGGTRRLGASFCEDADYLLFMTQDAEPADTRLTAALLAGFGGEEREPSVAAAYARQLARPGASWEERLTREFNYPAQTQYRTQADFLRIGVKAYFCSNVCAMYDGRIYRELGGFVRRTIFNEDMIYAGTALQAGYAVCYAAEAEVIHSHDYGALAQFHRNFDLGVSQAEHPEIFGGARSEGEGFRYVKSMTAALRRCGAAEELPRFLLRCAFRFIGYRAGRSYRHLPAALVRRCTMNPGYFRGGEQKS